MLKWSPEPFDAELEPQPSPVGRAEDFEATGTPVVSDSENSETEECQSGFRREAGFTDTKALMNSLTNDERSQVYELVELDLIEGYKIREQEMAAEYASRLAEVKSETERRFTIWTEKVSGVMAGEVRTAAAASARLAVQMAEKIIRRSVAGDAETLTRTIETTMFKIADGSPLSVRANPADVSWLEQHEEMKEQLNIDQIVSDRRIEPGGCVIGCDGREWDATLTRQLDTFSEIIEEMITTAEPDEQAFIPDPAASDATSETNTEPEVDDVPGVE